VSEIFILIFSEFFNWPLMIKKKTSHSLPSVKLRFSKGVRSSIMAIPITWRLSSVVNFHTFDFSSNRHDFFSVFKRNSAFEIGKIQFFVVSSVFSDLPKTLETAKFCYNKWFDWSNISILQYWPQSCLVLFRHVGMSSRVVVDRDFNTKTLDKGLKNVWKWE
jgi:hypothetical protein